jgi:cell division initiation protein
MSIPPEQPQENLPATESAADLIREAEFPLAVRGYDRHAVDEFLAQLSALVAELEGRQLRERVVQRALDEVGEQTAGILQRANETADELAARSRAQAEGRLQRAEREAELLKAESDKYAEQVAVDTRKLWAEREQLLEEVRRLADDVLATAEDAVERFKAPEAVATELARQEAAEGSVTAGQPEAEQETAPLDASRAG